MLTASSEFAQAFAAGDMYLSHRVIVEFGSNRFNDGQVVTASSTKPTSRGIAGAIQTPLLDFWKPSEAFNNKNRNSMKWLVCDRGATVNEVEDGTGYRAINIDDGEYERGWWSQNKSNGSGIFGSAEFVQSEFFMPDGTTPFNRRINKIVLYTFEHYANMKEVSVAYKDSVNGWTNVASNYVLQANTYKYEWLIPSEPLAQGLRVQIHATFDPNDYARISELQGIYVKDISTDIISIDVNETRQEYDGTVPIGITSANDFSMQLDNTTGKYNLDNTGGSFYPYLGANNTVYVEYGIDINQGEGSPSYQYLPMGTFYTDEWQLDGTGMNATVTGRDFSKFIQDEISQFPRVWINTNISTVLYDLMARAGKSSDEVEIDSNALRGFQILFMNDESIWSFMQEVAFADQGIFGFDRTGNFYYHSYNRLNEAPYNAHVYNLSYDQNIESGDIRTELYVNKVIVHVSPVNLTNTGRRSIWEANSPTILGWAKLGANITTSSTTLTLQTAPNQSVVNLTENGWPLTGYIWIPVVDGIGTVTAGEIIKYNSRTDGSFTECERGYLGTTPAAALNGAYVGEVRIFDIEYDNAPATKVFYPFMTAIDTLDRIEGEGVPQAHILQWEYNSFKAKLIIGNLVNFFTWIAGSGVSFKDLTDIIAENPSATFEEIMAGEVDISGVNDDVTIEFSTLVAGEVSVQDAGRQATGVDNELNAENKDYMRRYGKNELQVNNKWIQSKAHAEDIANIIISEYRVPRRVVDMPILPYPALELGDRVRITNYPALSIVNKDYHIIKATYTYDGGLRGNVTLREVKL